jgi:DNA-directed RNA polymerase sigma subunit (sigma70/sigma32)
MTRIQKTKKFRSILTKKPNFSKKLFATLWKNNLTIDELAAFFDVSDEAIRIAAKNLQFANKRKIKQELSNEWQPGDPTPEEIKERAAIVRQNWSEGEKFRRMGLRIAGPVNLKHFVYHVRTSSFSSAN